MSDPSQVPSKVEFNPKASDSIGINLNSPNVNISMLNWMDSIISSKALKLGMSTLKSKLQPPAIQRLSMIYVHFLTTCFLSMPEPEKGNTIRICPSKFQQKPHLRKWPVDLEISKCHKSIKIFI